MIEGFRQKEAILGLAKQINALISKLPTSILPLSIMEVCGGHTHALMRYGLLHLLDSRLRFVHGPGCPVCVMPKLRIDHALALARMPDAILLALADMLRVPGSDGTLQDLRAQGRAVRFVYSPLQALEIARANPHKQVIYFAIGFETTTPMSASLILRAREEKLSNLFLHINHVLVPPSVRAVLHDSHIRALIAPAHVSVITGARIYQPLVQEFKIPIVVAGFEPADMLEGIWRILQQVQRQEARLEIQYTRAVSMQGNLKAQALIEKTMQVRSSFEWRGLGEIAHSGLQIRPQYQDLDAEVVFAKYLPQHASQDAKACLCGEILKGVAKPLDCTLFNTVCTPTRPIGACMVSSEGACAAYYRYFLDKQFKMEYN
ncbi:hydrogenase formation protein HypD [Helicobacter sp. L8]|uniref:hydrogenase formation protein HypD n=1 Tax=Helicobacter sp. L8 TaxID=2316078 RepID=UPI000EAE0624|nr:hydrogenase formation protein HypD [Helicobacter sp. L8]